MGLNKVIDFSTAKLLKEKGFNKRSEPNRYNKIGELTLLEGINAPTIAEVIMWLYEKHGIWIAVTQELGYTTTFCYQIMGEHISATYKAYFKSPTEAYESAIKYCLTNLI